MSNSLSKLSDDAPLLELIERPLENMSNDDIHAYVRDLQEASTNTQAVKSRLTKKKTAKKKKQTATVKVDSLVDDLLK